MSTTSSQGSQVLGKRTAGVLLHITSLPGSEEHGTLGPEALKFIDFLADAGFGAWQILPIVPTHGDLSPYNGISSFAGNPNLLDFSELVARGWLERLPAELNKSDIELWQTILARFNSSADTETKQAWRRFIIDEAEWLKDYALYLLIRHQFENLPWFEWPTPYRDREAHALNRMEINQQDGVQAIYLQQFLIFRQWQTVKRRAAERQIQMIGDLPIFVAHDSVDCWTHPQLFRLDDQGYPSVVAGVPPDYFSATGQRWGNPCYDWEAMRGDGFVWWQRRFAHHFKLFDITRVDHFRGFSACWEIPAGDTSAVNGHWVSTPGKTLFKTLIAGDMQLPIIAEDLGYITEDVLALRDQFGLPGMKILQFGFDGDARNPYLPHNHVSNCVVYTGTHDNDTTLGWYQQLNESVKHKLAEYLGFPTEPMPWPLVRSALASIALLAVLPMQDLLGMDSEWRMNTPGTTSGNWRFRFQWSQLDTGLSSSLRAMNALYGRI